MISRSPLLFLQDAYILQGIALYSEQIGQPPSLQQTDFVPSPIHSAPERVAATMACMGVIPASTR